jgi:hypothetical protein
VGRRFGGHQAFGTASITLSRPSDCQATRPRLQLIQAPDSADTTRIRREDVDSLQEERTGAESRKGHRAHKEGVDQRDGGSGGLWGHVVRWEEAGMGHRLSRSRFTLPASGEPRGPQWM